MRTKAAAARFKTDLPGTEPGTFEAIVSVFGNIDSYGDRVIKGAFADTLAAWAEKGDPIPIIWSHAWGDPFAHIGQSLAVEERDEGLWVRGRLDVGAEPVKELAEQVHHLLKNRRVTNFSFAYDVDDEAVVEDDGGRKVNELRKMSLYEVGPCLVGVNSDTRLLDVKGLASEAPLAVEASRRPWHAKTGRVLSAANEDKVGRARDLLSDVLATLEGAEPPKGRRRAKTLDDSEAADLSDRLDDVADTLADIADALDPDDGDDGEDHAGGPKAAIGPHGTATDDDEWDANSAERNLADDATAAVYRRVYAWADPDGDPDTQAAYRFVHHRVAAEGTPGAASTVAATAGIAVLNGGRGGTTIPDGDRAGVYAHLRRHLADSGRDPDDIPGLEETGSSSAKLRAELAVLDRQVILAVTGV